MKYIQFVGKNILITTILYNNICHKLPKTTFLRIVNHAKAGKMCWAGV